ncbi:MAG TPA: histidine kinase dimerization/phospho-acceptor domain-containing protein, partial [Acidobacteriaceae bacterium]|nr:histidine kinase dimerization/phospho-acceptor domain-containing protein [Acidobacteriaceae bacterium]
MSLTHSGILLMTALLFLSAFRRLSTGLVFTVGGLLLWGLPGFLELALRGHPLPGLGLVNLVKVVAAIGMILLVLEEEIGANVAARQRDRRTRLEMERYTALYVAGIPVEDEGASDDEVCRTIAEVSRFSQAAIFMRSADGRFVLAGQAGMDGALTGALDAMARRTSVARARQIMAGSGLTPVAGSLMRLDLTPLLEPGDDLEQMNFRQCYAMVIRARDRQMQGVLVLAELRDPSVTLNIEDVLPLELLLARIGAAREHAALVRRLVQSERLAGLGQLAGGVAHELNNPLQAVTGFAELLADGEEPTTKTQATVILSEARRMKQIIDSLLRFRSASLMERMPVSVADLVTDLPTLLQSELKGAGVELEVKAPDELPQVRADAEQIRLVVVQVVKSAVGAFERMPEEEERRIRIEAEEHPRSVHLVISHTGRPFAEPARAFDPFFKPRPSRDGAEWPRAEEDPQGSGQGLGLSICYAIVREHGGAISAVNLHPKGAAVVIELPIAAASAAESSEADQRTVFAGKGQASTR